MRQATPPTAPAPPAGGAGTPPPVAVLLPTPIPISALPRTAQQVEGLRERREILRDQLDRATNRREELVGELNSTGAPEARAGIQQRLNLLDERILQLERDQAATEQLLSNASPDVLAMTAEPQQSGGMDDEAATALAFSMIGIGVLLAVIVGRWRRRRARRRGRTGEASAALSNDARMQQLTDSVNAIAEEVERIGEGQRFVTRLLAERKEPVTRGQL